MVGLNVVMKSPTRFGLLRKMLSFYASVVLSEGARESRPRWVLGPRSPNVSRGYAASGRTMGGGGGGGAGTGSVVVSAGRVPPRGGCAGCAWPQAPDAARTTAMPMMH